MYSSSISNISNTNLIYNNSRSHTPERVVVGNPENSMEVIPCQNLGGATAEIHIETATYVYNRHGGLTWNDAEALYNRAGQYDQPLVGFDPDYFLDLRNSADLGHVEAQYEFGLNFDSYIVGRGTTQPIPYLRLAADQGHVEAQFEYGRRVMDYYYEGPSNRRRFENEPNFEDAEVYLQRAAQAGHVDAAIMYADLFTQPPQRMYNGADNPIPLRNHDQRVQNFNDAMIFLSPHAIPENPEALAAYERLRDQSPFLSNYITNKIPKFLFGWI